MKCLHPRIIGSRGYIPCGKCRACQAVRCTDWIARFMCEHETFKRGAIFATLTYNDEALPADGNVSKEDIALFVKRVKRKFNAYNIGTKYMYCSEYGSRTGRAHYHIMITGLFNHEPSKIERQQMLADFAECWSKYHKGSFVNVSEVISAQKSIRYMVNYSLKDDYYSRRPGESEAEYELRVGRKAPFVRFSSGIGKDYALKNQDKLIEQGYMKIGGQKFAIPRYFRKKFELSQNEEQFARTLDVVKEFYDDKIKKKCKACAVFDSFWRDSGLFERWRRFDRRRLARYLPGYKKFSDELNKEKTKIRRKINLFDDVSRREKVITAILSCNVAITEESCRTLFDDIVSFSKEQQRLAGEHDIEHARFFLINMLEDQLIAKYFGSRKDYAEVRCLIEEWNYLLCHIRACFLDEYVQRARNMCAKIDRNMAFRRNKQKKRGFFDE